MYRICFTIKGKRHCIDIPMLVDPSHIKRPPPGNFPELELALTVLQLVQVVKPTELSKQLSDVSNRFVDQLKKDLPQGVEIGSEQAHGGH